MFGYNLKARKLQLSVRFAEARLDTDYGDDEVRRAIVHAREDIVLLYSLMEDANNQLVWIRILLAVIAVLCAAIVFDWAT
jgi:hypothetical protein